MEQEVIQLIPPLNASGHASTIFNNEATINNNNNEVYLRTLAHWRTTTKEMLDTCKTSLHRYEKIMSYFNLIIFFISTLMTLIGMIQYVPVQYTSIIKVLLVVLPATSTFISGILKIFAIQEKIKSCQTFLLEVDNFYSELVTREYAPPDMLIDIRQFIQKNLETYYQICRRHHTYNP